jgi:hypothetical protein
MRITILEYATLICSKANSKQNLPRLVYPDEKQRLVVVSSGCRYRDYPEKVYDSLVTALAFLREAGFFGHFVEGYYDHPSCAASSGTRNLATIQEMLAKHNLVVNGTERDVHESVMPRS